MALIIPGSPAFAHCTHNLTGTPPQALVGVNFTAAANSADGSSVSVLGALAHDVQYLVVGIGGLNSAGVDSSALLDILTDPAGGTSWGAWINDLAAGFTPLPALGTTPLTLWYHFPIYLKSGHSVGVRARNTSASNLTTGRVVIYAYGGPKNPDRWWCGSRVESLGINAASSKGTDVTAGSTGADGSWTTIGTSTGCYGALQFAVNGVDAATNALGYYWQVGAGSVQLAGTPTLYSSDSTGEQSARTGEGLMWVDVLSGTVMQMRGTCSGTAEVHNCAVYGVM